MDYTESYLLRTVGLQTTVSMGKTIKKNFNTIEEAVPII